MESGSDFYFRPAAGGLCHHIIIVYDFTVPH